MIPCERTEPKSLLCVVLTSSRSLFVPQHADVLAQTLAQCDGHGANAAELKAHTHTATSTTQNRENIVLNFGDASALLFIFKFSLLIKKPDLWPQSLIRQKHESHLIDASASGDGADASDVGGLAAAAHERPPTAKTWREIWKEVQVKRRKVKKKKKDKRGEGKARRKSEEKGV